RPQGDRTRDDRTRDDRARDDRRRDDRTRDDRGARPQREGFTPGGRRDRDTTSGPRDERRPAFARGDRAGRDDQGVRAARTPRPDEPELPADLDPFSLDRDVREQLKTLAKGIAEQVTLRLVAAGELLDVDPEAALAHAVVARRLASRVPVVREAVGIAA